MAEIVFEDIYISLFKRDGLESAEALRAKVVKREQHGDALQNFRTTFGNSIRASTSGTNMAASMPPPSMTPPPPMNGSTTPTTFEPMNGK